MFGWFKKKKVTEDTVKLCAPVPRVGEYDDIALCTRCVFKGRCKFRRGCKSLNAVLANRTEKLRVIRGYAETEHRRSPNDTRYMRTLKWVDQLNDNLSAFCHVNYSDGTSAIVGVTVKTSKGNVRSSSEVSVPYTFVQDESGNDVVDIAKFRLDVKRKIVL